MGQRRCAREIHLEQTRIYLDTSESLHFFLKSLIGNQQKKMPFPSNGKSEGNKTVEYHHR